LCRSTSKAFAATTAIDSAGLDRKVLAARGVDAVLKMILVDGVFHADPHPGNVMYLPDNRIALIDFGMVGRLSPARRGQIIDLLAGLAGHDEEAMLEVLLDWRGDEFVDEARLAADLSEFAFDYADMQLKDLKIGCSCIEYRRSCASTPSCCRAI
jgi:ubiquinone biosynthesis protein